MKIKTLLLLAFVSLLVVIFCQTERDGWALGRGVVNPESPWAEYNINDHFDNDGIPNGADLCPYVGAADNGKLIDGCPDSDGDGIKDYREEYYDGGGRRTARMDKTIIDFCPKIAAPGLDIHMDESTYNGCPTNCQKIPPGALARVDLPTEATSPIYGDDNGDGLAEIPYYLCPRNPSGSGWYSCFWNRLGGDGSLFYPDADCDGVLDSTEYTRRYYINMFFDECPSEPGSKYTKGCPDVDYDDIRDSEDGCPNERGSSLTLDGCPIRMPGREPARPGTIEIPSPGSRLEGRELRPVPLLPMPSAEEEVPPAPPTPEEPTPPPAPPAGSTETTTPTGSETATTPSTTEGTVEVKPTQTPGSSPYSRKDFTGRESYGLNQGGGCSLHPLIRIE